MLSILLEEENKSGRTRGGAAAVLLEEDFHILTKLHHTHLGYERTTLAISESVADFQSLPHIHLRVVLHGTKFCETIEGRQKCEQDEQNLPQYVKDVGSAPYYGRKIRIKFRTRAHDYKHWCVQIDPG